MLLYIEDVIRFFIYLLMLIFAWIALMPLFRHKMRSKPKRFRPISIDDSLQTQSASGWFDHPHIRHLLSVTLNRRTSYSVLTFYVVSAICFTVTLLFLSQAGHSIPFSLIVGCLIGAAPYGILRVRLHNIQVNSSYEADALLSELISNYKVHWFNMIEAIDRTIPQLKNEPFTRKALFKLSVSIKQYRSEEELEDLIQEFAFSIGTKWSIMLANNLTLAIGYGDNVKDALEDILSELKSLKQINEKDKRENAEAFFMVYFAPLLYVGGVYAMFQYFGFNFKKFIDYQFHDPTGSKFFTVMTLAIIFNFIIYFYVRRPKNDF